MSVLLAVKRSYRYFVPSSLRDPRRSIRRVFTPIVFYMVGLSTGMMVYADRAQHDRIVWWSILGFLALIILREYIGKNENFGEK